MTIVLTQRQLGWDTPQHDHRVNTENSVQIHHSMAIVLTQRQLGSDTPQHDHRVNTEKTRLK